MRVLALEPYYGGSHRSFLDDWIARSEHDWTLFTLPAHHWKWRMRHGAVTLADDVRAASDTDWDVLFCSDMLNLAEFRGLAPEIAHLPTVIYFHENQLTYPTRHPDERDLHFAFSNFASAVAADQVWFNSRFHQNEFLDALVTWFKRLPDHQPLTHVDAIRAKSHVFPPSIESWPERSARDSGPLRIVWSARWEFDKNPAFFFDALRTIKSQGLAFRLSVLGESFRDVPEEFAAAKTTFADEIENWGFLPDRAAYREVLSSADVFVSTADHEFFGIAAAEAIAAGAFPLLPNRLAYPELLAVDPENENLQFLHDGSQDDLVTRLSSLIERKSTGEDLYAASAGARHSILRFTHELQVQRRDEALIE